MLEALCFQSFPVVRFQIRFLPLVIPVPAALAPAKHFGAGMCYKNLLSTCCSYSLVQAIPICMIRENKSMTGTSTTFYTAYLHPSGTCC